MKLQLEGRCVVLESFDEDDGRTLTEATIDVVGKQGEVSRVELRTWERLDLNVNNPVTITIEQSPPRLVFVCQGACNPAISGRRCDCWKLHGGPAGTRTPPLHDGCTCVLEILP